MKNDESGQAIVEYAILVGFVAVVLIPVLTTFTIAVNRYFENRVKDIHEAEVKQAQTQDLFIQYMDQRIAYLECLVNLNPNQPSSACGPTP